MFKKTRIRLTVLNAIVFFLLLNAFGSTLYFYMQHRLFEQADQQLRENAEHIQGEHFHDLAVFQKKPEEREADRRIVYVLWDSNGQVRLQVPSSAVLTDDMNDLQNVLSAPNVSTVNLGGQTYRTLSVATHHDLLVDNVPIQTVQLVYSLGPEQSMLDSLLLVIVVAGVISVLAAMLVGWFLASKALVPIQRSWDKQQEFVEDASHELRTPLAVMKTHLERLFRHPEHTIEQESGNISEVINETRRMSKLVAQLLTLARSDSNQVELLVQKLRLDEIAERVVTQFRELAVVKDIQIEKRIDSPLEMLGDEERLYQLFVILLDNALKYTPEQGRITVSCHRNTGAIQITVTDTGLGISKEDLPHIFDRFFRGDKARTRTEEGTGLGLAIAQWIVESHGGKIRAESELGVGTNFHVSLPIRTRA